MPSFSEKSKTKISHIVLPYKNCRTSSTEIMIANKLNGIYKNRFDNFIHNYLPHHIEPLSTFLSPYTLQHFEKTAKSGHPLHMTNHVQTTAVRQRKDISPIQTYHLIPYDLAFTYWLIADCRPPCLCRKMEMEMPPVHCIWAQTMGCSPLKNVV